MITGEYVSQLKQVHAARTWGASGYSHAATVAQWRRKLGARTVLDYGCGQGTLKPELISKDRMRPEWVAEYDPAIPGKDAPPEPADLLVANDVLEHIEPDYLSQTLDYMVSLAKIGAYFTIALTPSKVSLPDGRNAHLIIESDQWWRDRLRQAGFAIARAEMRKGLWVWART